MKNKLLMGVSIALGILFCAVAIVVSSVWVENRFPSDDAKQALLPAAQRVVTKPIVNALGHQIGRYVQSVVEDNYLKTGLTLEETMARFLDERVDLGSRRIYAYRLARAGTPEAIAALRKVFLTAPPRHKLFMAQLIGSAGTPAAKTFLLSLLDDTEAQVVRAAIRGLSVTGTEDATVRVAQLLADSQRPELVRIEAALGLGTIGTPAARTALVEVLARKPSDELTTQVLSSLGQFEFPAIAETFTRYLAAADTPRDMRVAAVEALADSSPEAASFLMDLAGNDAEAEVRASAAWAISVHNTVTDLGPALTALAEKETEADVRRRLYEALLPQTSIAPERLLPLVMAENDIAARVAGFNAVGRAVNLEPASAIAAVFDKDIVPELVRIATAPNSLNIQMRAVFALRRAQTPAAETALTTIANRAAPQIAFAARHGLRPPNS
jgi:HEAT repeat protein